MKDGWYIVRRYENGPVSAECAVVFADRLCWGRVRTQFPLDGQPDEILAGPLDLAEVAADWLAKHPEGAGK